MPPGGLERTGAAEPAGAPERLRLLEAGTTAAVALDFFDTLPAVDPSALVGLGTAGSWRGSEIPTRHPLDGVLERLGWHGKRFDTEEDVHPLVFRGRDDRLVCVDPRFLPLGLALRVARLLRTAPAARAFALVRPALATTRPQARLRAVEYRGTVSAAMVYDRQPIIDAFRRVDEHTVLGVMDLRGMRMPYVFVLRREAG
ncbi:DUF4334 domain-containing protein [Sanguibacter sp. 25GB23B1]|uniref:DUF4334 domain-containing protein n=1 Tax=unclassified Sanguibacter TaxID=2645534 RepID=UPI0032AFC0AC